MANILIITDDVFTYSGREKVCSFMLDEFSKSNDVDIFSFEQGKETFHDFSLANNIYTPSQGGDGNKVLEQILIRNNYAYVFVASMGRLSIKLIPLVLRFRRKNIKFIACEHVSFASLNPIVKILKLIGLRFYYKVVLLTHYDKKTYKKYGVNAEVIFNHLRYRDIKKMSRNNIALAVGRLSYQKNFAQLIDIWKGFTDEVGKGWKLNIAGEGELHNHLKNKIKEKGLEEDVILLGKVSDMDKLYRESDICLMTSIYEGLPLALLEAKSYSLPCIAFDCKTGPAEIISNGVDGFVITDKSNSEFIEALKKIASDDELYYRLSNNTLVTSEKFEEKNIRQQWNSLINE